MIGRFSSMDKELKDTVFCIVGLGLIGGSYAKALRRLGVKKIIGVDSDKAVLGQALKEDVIDATCSVPDESLQEADVIIFAVYPAVIYDFVKKNVQYFKTGVLLTDAAGIKGDIIEGIDELLSADMDFVAGHPMAGREGRGFSQSAAEIFDGANYIVVPRPGNHQDNINWLKKFDQTLGCKRVVEVSRQQHDRIIAYTSQLAHVVSNAYVKSPTAQEHKGFSAGSYKDLTRVARLNAPMWTELFLDNADNLSREVGTIIENLQAYKDAIDARDAEKLQTLLAEGDRLKREAEAR